MNEPLPERNNMVSDERAWAAVREPAVIPKTSEPRNSTISVRYNLHGQPLKAGGSTIIPWSSDYQKTLVQSKNALKRHLPTVSEGWSWWIATPDPEDPNSLIEISPEAFGVVVGAERIKLFLCGDPVTSDVILYRSWPEPDPELYYNFKVLAIGDSSIGKTTFMRYFSDMKYVEVTPTVLCDDLRTRRFVNRSGRPIQILLRDTGNQERFNSLPPSMFRDVSGAFLMYDMNQPFSADKLKEWLDKARQFDDNLPVLLVGTKSDQCKEKISTSKSAIQFQTDHNLLGVLVTSSKSGDNVDAAFQMLVQGLYAHAERDEKLADYLKGPSAPKRPTLEPPRRGGGWC